MRTTANHSLRLLDGTDPVDKDDINYNTEALDAAVPTIKFIKCTQAEYDAMQTHDADTVYIIVG